MIETTKEKSQSIKEKSWESCAYRVRITNERLRPYDLPTSQSQRIWECKRATCYKEFREKNNAFIPFDVVESAKNFY